MTISDLLYSKEYRGNQSVLATEMNINRGTLRKYLLDEEGAFHFVKENNGEYELFAKVGGK